MKSSIKNIFIITCISILWSFSGQSSAISSDEMIRAKIGIRINSDSKNAMAKSRDRLKPGDLFRIYVNPENASFIYVVYSDKKEANLLQMVEQKTKNSILVFPSITEFYEVDGTSEHELFTIICSPKKINSLETLINPGTSYEKWVSLETDLIKESQIVLTEKSETPFAISGSVRGVFQESARDSFYKRLRIYSGKSFIVKKYEFHVKK